MEIGPDTQTAHPARAAVSGVDDQLAELAAANLWSLPDADLLDLRIALEATRARLEAAVLAVTREVDGRGAAVATGAATTAAWLRGRLLMHPGAAQSEVALAAALNGELADTGQALAAGDISREHASAVSAAIRALPGGVDAATRREAQAWLLEQAGQFDPAAIAKLSRHLVLTLDPDRGKELERDEARRESSQEFTIVHGSDGARRLRGQLGPEGGALLEAAIGALAQPRKAEDGTPDSRTAAQRRAEALVELVVMALDSQDMPEHGGEPVTMTVTTRDDYLRAATAEADGCSSDEGLPPAATLEDGTALTPETTRRLGCDAWLVEAIVNSDGNVLDIGRLSRTVPRSIRRALVVRDGGCAFPGCGRPPRWCHGHHIWHWALGGPTSLSNLVLLCGHHHRLVHHGGWAVYLNPRGLPEFRPPPWVDPSQIPRPAWRPPRELLLT